ncbi:MAG: response regulator [Burkholderiales bacterium]|nr:response regulator [Burkholderiales bacterium]
MFHIMAVDDEPSILNALRRNLNSLDDDKGQAIPIQLDCFSDPFAALEAADKKAYDAVISDYRMPGMNGVEFLMFFRTKQPDAVRIVLSGFADFEGIIAAINDAQIFRYVSKPWHEGELKHALRQSLATRALMLENIRLADLVRAEQLRADKQTQILKRLEEETPGITKVKWGPNGEVLLDD